MEHGANLGAISSFPPILHASFCLLHSPFHPAPPSGGRLCQKKSGGHGYRRCHAGCQTRPSNITTLNKLRWQVKRQMRQTPEAERIRALSAGRDGALRRPRRRLVSPKLHSDGGSEASGDGTNHGQRSSPPVRSARCRGRGRRSPPPPTTRQNFSAQKSRFALRQQQSYIRTMSKTAAIRTRIEPGLKQEVEDILADLSL